MKAKRKRTQAAIEVRIDREINQQRIQRDQKRERTGLNVVVKHHAVVQYQTKMFDPDITVEESVKELTKIARKGQIIHSRPAQKNPVSNPVYEIRYNDLSIAAEVTKDTITIITFLGDRRYRAWAKTKEIALRYA